MITINADRLQDGLYQIQDGQIHKYKAKGGTVRTYEMGEIVRCRDCRHRDLFSCPLTDNDFQKDDDFCSWGDRRQNDGSDRSDKGAESDDRATSGQE